MPTKLIYTPRTASLPGADGTCKLDSEDRVDPKSGASPTTALHPIYGKAPGSVRAP